MSINSESLYRQLGRLLEAVPEFPSNGPLSNEQHQWLARAYALVYLVKEIEDKSTLKNAMDDMMKVWARPTAIETIKINLFRALAALESQVSPRAKGAFIPVGSAFDAFTTISKLFQDAKKDVFVVDPYMDETVLTEFGGATPSGVTLRLLADSANSKATLKPAAVNWVAQYGKARPLAVRFAPARSLHDRAVFVDGVTAWTLTQSFKDFAKRSPAEIVRVDDIASLKITAYGAIWTNSQIVV